ncbi:PQQ-binding-like beta-propeller repeat protein [Mariniflexile litorale]|uniref:PQQ-binding-like beta-propeller repeat protein n=1 Tax=Mariniflexile litorale TaxID=3045158 RepID=A0AAU7EEB7_9FLAO|nr:PQQ-binding-like beta-propeller repeat protein [Mariniflexile sp. KMM 9835]MDQ8212007.1 PQQ-binding-like beta-propeller repeat protein [Mariniflexile sp. KMM 9835]
MLYFNKITVIRNLFIVLVCCVFLSCGGILQNKTFPRKTTTWVTVHGNSHNSDFLPVEGPKNIRLKWSKKLDGVINLGATNDLNGRVYITSTSEDCHLYALDASTGETFWCTDIVNEYAVASSVLVDLEGHLFIADDKAMHAFNEAGHLLWRSPIIGFPLSAQFTKEGSIIFITHIGVIYVMDRKSGKNVLNPYFMNQDTVIKFESDPTACMRGTKDCPSANTLAIHQPSGKFFFTYWRPNTPQASIIAMQYSEKPNPTLTHLWENNSLPGGSTTSPVISADGKKVYVNDNYGSIHALSTHTGDKIWEYNLGYETGGSQSTSPDGYIMPAGGGRSPLTSIKDLGEKPELVWSDETLNNRGVATQTKGNLSYPTVSSSTRGRFYNDLLVVDVLTGTVLDREPLPVKTFFTVGTTVDQDGVIYVASFNGYLFAFEHE